MRKGGGKGEYLYRYLYRKVEAARCLLSQRRWLSCRWPRPLAASLLGLGSSGGLGRSRAIRWRIAGRLERARCGVAAQIQAGVARAWTRWSRKGLQSRQQCGFPRARACACSAGVFVSVLVRCSWCANRSNRSTGWPWPSTRRWRERGPAWSPGYGDKESFARDL